MKTQGVMGIPAVRALAVIAAGVGVLAVAGTPAMAQGPAFDYGDNPNVTVDMSVLESGGRVPAAPTLAPGTKGTRLLLPPAETPVSRLLVRPSTGGGTELPPPEKGRVAMTPPAGPGMPPAEPPVSTLAVPAKAAPPPPPVSQPAATPPASEPPPRPRIAAAPPPPPSTKAETAPAAPPAPPAEKPRAEKPTKAPPPPAVVPPPPPQPADAGKVAQVPVPPAPAKEQASLPPAGAAKPGQTIQVVFEASAAKLPDSARDDLKAVVAKIIDQPNLRVQLLAYAGGDSLSASKARRLSLSRALSVRSYLIEAGLRSTRIDVRALGDKTTDEPMNRVEINVVER